MYSGLVAGALALLLGGLPIVAAIALWPRIRAWAEEGLFPWVERHLPKLAPLVRNAYAALDNAVTAVRRMAWQYLREHLLHQVVTLQRRSSSEWVRGVTSWILALLPDGQRAPVRIVAEGACSWDEERSLNTVQEVASDPEMLAAAADKLREMGGIPGRLGSQLKALFENGPAVALTKEGAGVLSTVARHLAFLDSELVARSVASSTFHATDLLKPGTTLFLQIPPDQLEAQKGLLRCWISTLIRVIGAVGDERCGEVLFLLDEASALGSLSALEEALVRGRSAGVRLFLAYQSDNQVQTAFKDKPTLLYDNCTTQIYLGAASIETAERLSKSLGEWTQVLEGYGENGSRSWNTGGTGPHQGEQHSQGSSFNYSVAARALLKPDEILNLNDDYLIAFQRGLGAPILGRRVKWYQDPEFNPAARRLPLLWWSLLAATVALIVWALASR